ncbi:MAG: ThuA domain-containing protein [Capsulimonadales bacterium]|nr:ThuA domain-containing protein [Capsulimonadales bacterium]
MASLPRRTLSLLALLLLTAAAFAAPPKKLLVVTVTKGFRHGDSIEVGEKILAEMAARDRSFVVDYVRNDEEMAQKMTPAALKGYDGVLFLNTTGDLPLPDRDAFMKWIEAGRGFVGTHSATDTFHGYPPYLDMIGAEFKTHGAQSEVNCLVMDRKHPATKPLGASFKVFDEIYQFQRYDRTKFRDLFSLDRHPNEGTPGYYPLSWCRMQGKGRVFYTALGHRPDVWQSAWYQAHLLGGIRWALGLERGDARPQTVSVNSAAR